jgi:hypothetical protein
VALRHNLSQAKAVESRYDWTIIDGNRIAEASTNFRPLLELEFAIDNYVQTAAAWHQSQQTPSCILFTDFVTEWQATQGTSPN